MNNIDGALNSSLGNYSRNQKNLNINKLQKASLKRNRPERVSELTNKTKNDAKVSIPESIKDFARIKKIVDMTPPKDNSEKIQALKKQIQAGTYKVDHEKIADKILKSEF